jgi:hypothetical protein
MDYKSIWIIEITNVIEIAEIMKLQELWNCRDCEATGIAEIVESQAHRIAGSQTRRIAESCNRFNQNCLFVEQQCNSVMAMMCNWKVQVRRLHMSVKLWERRNGEFAFE